MKKIFSSLLLTIILLILTGSLSASAADFTDSPIETIENPTVIPNANTPKDIYEPDGSIYKLCFDQNSNYYYSLYQASLSGQPIDIYQVKSEINGIPVKSIKYSNATEELVLTNNIQRLESECFMESGPRKLNIPDSVTYIGDSAFWLSNIQNLSIGNGIKALTSALFDDCRRLTEVTIRDGVREIKTNAFIGCCNIKKITLPPSIENIERNAFGILLDSPVIYGYTNSYAHHWALGMGYEFHSIGTVTPIPDDLPLLSKPTITGNRIELSVENAAALPWDWYSYELTAVLPWYDEDTDITYSSMKYRFIQNSASQTTAAFKYLPAARYYIRCRGYKKGTSGTTYSPWSLPRLTHVTEKLTTPPTYQKTKITQASNGTRTVTITLKNPHNFRFDCVLGTTQTNSPLYIQTTLSNTLRENISDYKPANYVHVLKARTGTTVTFKNVKPGTYYFGAHSFTYVNGLKNFSTWSVPKKIVIR